MSVLDYIFEKLKDDYAMVSLDYSIGSFATNVYLVCQLWFNRIYRHLINNGFKFNENKFIVDHPPVYTCNSES
jgi:hypothetical protein